MEWRQARGQVRVAGPRQGPIVPTAGESGRRLEGFVGGEIEARGPLPEGKIGPEVRAFFG